MMKKNVLLALLGAFLVCAVPAAAAVKIYAPVKEEPRKPVWQPLTDAEYAEFLNDPDFALADRNLRLIWRDAQRELPLERLEVIRAQQEEWEKTGRDRDAENKSWGDVTQERRREAYKEAILLRSQWLWNKFGSPKTGVYDGSNYGGYCNCGWVDYEKRIFYYVHRMSGGIWPAAGYLDAQGRLTYNGKVLGVFKTNTGALENGDYPIKIKFRDETTTEDWPGADWQGMNL